MDECLTFGKCVFWPENKFRWQWPIFHGPVILLLLFFALKNILVLLAKLNSGELRCPPTALILPLIEIHTEDVLSLTNLIGATTWQNQQNECAPSEDSDQPRHPPSLIKVFAVCLMGSKGPKISSCGQRRLWSDWADDQADLNLRWAHSHFVGFVMSRLIFFLSFFFVMILFLNSTLCFASALEQNWATACQNQNDLCTYQRLRSAWASHPVWSEFSLSAWRNLKFLVSCLSAQWRLIRLGWLIRVFVGPTCHFVGFVVLRLRCML